MRIKSNLWLLNSPPKLPKARPPTVEISYGNHKIVFFSAENLEKT